MNRHRLACFRFPIVWALAGLACGTGWADIGPRPLGPISRKGPAAPLTVRIDRRAKVSRIVIPQRHMPELGAAPRGGGAWGDGRTIFAGIAISAAVVSLVLLRRRSAPAAKGALAGIVVLSAGLLSGLAGPSVADVPPPPAPPSKMIVEVSRVGNQIELILAPDDVPQLRGRGDGAAAPESDSGN